MANEYSDSAIQPSFGTDTGPWWQGQYSPTQTMIQTPPPPSPDSFAPGQIAGFGQAPAAYVPPSIAAPIYQPPQTPTFDKFVAPTAQEAANAPGTQFALQQAQLGSERSAAAKGSLLSGGFQKELGSYLENVASGLYGTTFNQKLQGTGFNNQIAQTGFEDASQTAQNQYANAFQNYAAANLQAANAYNTNYNTSHTAANDYYQALLDQQKLGQQAGTQAVGT